MDIMRDFGVLATSLLRKAGKKGKQIIAFAFTYDYFSHENLFVDLNWMCGQLKMNMIALLSHTEQKVRGQDL